MLGFYNYTVVLTYIGMLVSFFGITCALNGNICSALNCLMISGVCDMFDGKIASTKDRTIREKRFGIQIDSLSDLICFGVLPAVITYIVSGKSVVSLAISSIYLLCALIRLAYFNVDEEERQNSTSTSREFYLGLPVTTAALIVPAAIALGCLYSLPLSKTAPIALAIMSVAFITPFKLKKPAGYSKIGMIIFGGAELFILMAVVNI